jgi:hypothetical protein
MRRAPMCLSSKHLEEVVDIEHAPGVDEQVVR